jgi:hypothetical protein
MEIIRNKLRIEDSENAVIAAEYLAETLNNEFPDVTERHPKHFFHFEVQYRNGFRSAISSGTSRIDFSAVTIHGGMGGGHNKGGTSPEIPLVEIKARNDVMSFRMLEEDAPERPFRSFVARILEEGRATGKVGKGIEKVVEIQKRG